MRSWLRAAGVSAVFLFAVACSKGAPATEVEEVTQGAASSTGEWTLTTSVDDQGRLITEVTPKRGYRINVDYPWKLTVEETAQGQGEAATFDEKKVRFVSDTQAAAGSTVEGELRFSICNDATCLTPRETVSWQL